MLHFRLLPKRILNFTHCFLQWFSGVISRICLPNVSKSILLIFTISVHICLHCRGSAYCDPKNLPHNIFSSLSFIVVIAGEITVFITIIILLQLSLLLLFLFLLLLHSIHFFIINFFKLPQFNFTDSTRT